MSKIIECTGSPKPYFKTKSDFLSALEPYGYKHGKMKKKNNMCDILCCDDLSSTTAKMELAKSLGVEIMTYADLAEAFDLETEV